MPKHLENTLPGRASVCWNCDEKMALDSDNMKFDFPFCLTCRMENGNIAGTNDEDMMKEFVLRNAGKMPVLVDKVDNVIEDKPIVTLTAEQIKDLFK